MFFIISYEIVKQLNQCKNVRLKVLMIMTKSSYIDLRAAKLEN